MKIVNNGDRTIHFDVQGPGSKTVWEGDLTQSSTTEKQLSGILNCSLTFHTDPPQLAGDYIPGLNGNSTLIIQQLYCGVKYSAGGE